MIHVIQAAFVPVQYSSATVQPLIDMFGPSLFAFGWLAVIVFLLATAWQSYRTIKMIDYVSAVEWTCIQISLPSTALETPKSMEVFYDVIGGIHKSPDLNELFFDGYLEAWYSCELHCTQGKSRYIMVVPTAHRNFFEGIIYGQYPHAEIKEVEDYTLRYRWQDIRKTFDMYGTEMVPVEDDIYPIRTYIEFEATLAEEDPFVDPHQAMVESFSNVQPGEEYWFQLVVRPKDAKAIAEWTKRGEKEVAIISGKETRESSDNILFKIARPVFTAISTALSTFISGMPPEYETPGKEGPQLRFFNPVDEAKMKGVTLKVSHSGYKAILRVIHIAPLGQLKKPNIGRAIGAFKQFNTFHLNSLKPDDKTKTNGPNYVMREARRRWRERVILLLFQWRDMFGPDAGNWFNAEELATLYHFPVKDVRSPSVERAKAGVQGPPDNVPYA